MLAIVRALVTGPDLMILDTIRWAGHRIIETLEEC